MPEIGTANLTWLGQAGFLLEIEGLTILLDPYLSDSLAKKYAGKLFEHKRMMDNPLRVDEDFHCDAYLCSHGHTDHMDPETIQLVQKFAKPNFLYPRFEAETAKSRGIPTEHFHGINAGELVELSADVSVMAIPAAHEELVINQKNEYKCLGYVIMTDGLNIYHSGDCAPYAGQAQLLRSLNVNVALLPVNGRDSYRLENGVPGNFHAHEAVALCEEAGIHTLIPHHWGMFEFNTIDPYSSKDLTSSSNVDVRIPELGKTISVGFRGAVAA